MCKRKTQDEYVAELAVKNPNVEIIGEYIGSTKLTLHRCKKHDIVWETYPINVLRGAGCDLCKGEKISSAFTFTRDEYINEIAIKNPTVELIGEYIKSNIKTTHRCLICGYEWEISPDNIKHGEKCPECAKKKSSERLKMEHEEYVSRLNALIPDMDVLESYDGCKTDILHRCNSCMSVVMLKPVHLLNNGKCPICAGKMIGPAPEYKNSIFASEYRDFYSQYMTIEQMQSYFPKSGKKVEVTCPDCGRKKLIKPIDLINKGLGCICSDGQSFANKFVYNVLNQLKLDIKSEYSPKWANKKRYDCYVKDYNLIIENHGEQHYKECALTTRTLEEEQENDKLKEQLAYDNGIKNYVVLDCRHSTLNHIKNSIISSTLPKMFGFSENDIDWAKATAYASRSLVKQAAELYNQGYLIKDIASQLHVAKSTIRIWLKRATDAGFCKYIKHEPRKPYCIELNMYFEDIRHAAKYVCGVGPAINQCCTINQNRDYSNMRHAYYHPETNEQLSWLFLDDAIAQGYVKL